MQSMKTLGASLRYFELINIWCCLGIVDGQFSEANFLIKSMFKQKLRLHIFLSCILFLDYFDLLLLKDAETKTAQIWKCFVHWTMYHFTRTKVCWVMNTKEYSVKYISMYKTFFADKRILVGIICDTHINCRAWLAGLILGNSGRIFMVRR